MMGKKKGKFTWSCQIVKKPILSIKENLEVLTLEKVPNKNCATFTWFSFGGNK